MSDREIQSLSPEQERALDRLVGDAMQAEPERNVDPGEDATLAYVWGHANQEQTNAVERALDQSASYRRKVRGILRAHTAFAETEDDQAAVATPARVTTPPKRWEWLTTLVLHPAFAYGFTLLLLGYPAYRYLAGSGSGTQRVIGMQVEILSGEPGDVPRSGSATSPKDILVTSDKEVLSLLLQAPPDFDARAPFHVSLVVPSGELVVPRFSPQTASIGGSTCIQIGIVTKSLSSGLAVVRLEYTKAGGASGTAAYSYSFHLRNGR